MAIIFSLRKVRNEFFAMPLTMLVVTRLILMKDNRGSMKHFAEITYFCQKHFAGTTIFH